MSAPLAASDTSAMILALAGKYRVEIDTGVGNTTTWTEVKGIKNFAPKSTQTTEDDTDISSDGHASSYPVGQAWTADISGLTKGTGTDAAMVVDPGVQALLNASEEKGAAGIVHIRYWRTDSLPEAKEVYATCEVTRDGEEPPALDKWSGTLTGRGKPINITKPTEEDETP